HAAKGGNFGRDKSGVDTYDSVFESFGDAPDARQIFAVEISGKAEFGCVGESDRLGFGFEAEERRDGAEGLFTGDSHLWRDFSEDGWLKKAAAQSVLFAPQ